MTDPNGYAAIDIDDESYNATVAALASQKPKRLYVVYSYRTKPGRFDLGGGIVGQGRTIYTLDPHERLETMEDVLTVEEALMRDNPSFESCFLTFWKELEG